MLTVGNQTQLATEDLIEHLCEDPRITVFGLRMEGVKGTARKTGKGIAARDAERVAGKNCACTGQIPYPSLAKY